MKIKTKLTLGVGLLFALILLLGIVSATYINTLKSDTENILIANYNSLQYSQNILSLIEDPTPKNRAKMEQNIVNQENNITEIGEQEATRELRHDFNQFKNNTSDSLIVKSIRASVAKIMDMNMQAIERKSELAKTTANEAVFWIAVAATICFLIAFTLLINLPSNIANPIKELTQSIQQIADKNYSQRVHFEGSSEFGQLARSFNTMALKLEEYNSSNLAKMMIEKKRTETLINNMHDPIIGLDEALNIIFINEEALKIAGLNNTFVIGQSAQALAVNNDLIRLLIRDIARLENLKEDKTKPIKIFADNKESYFEKDTLHIHITPTGETKQKLVGHVIVLRNVTAYKELDLAKTNFIATVSHEFKTPIASIIMSLQLLENKQIGALNDEQKHLVESIKDDTDRLLKITGELLNMTQVESGNIQISKFPTDPKEMLDYAIQATKTQAEQKQIKFEVSCPENLPKVQTDSEKTAWVLTNLISNAIRYSYDHSVIYLSITQSAKNIIISVKDTGQGIAPQYQGKIFDRYFRVPNTKKEGTGLGLAISKEFIEAQGGQISVKSELGTGSTFSVILEAVV
jgi:PAS domain S-box-containing protein